MLKRLMIVALAALALAACESPKYVVSDVTRFHSLPVSGQGKSFAIAPVSADQGQSLAFHQYADLLTAKLAALGLRPASPSETPDYIVTLDYSVRGPTPDVYSWGYGPDWGPGWGWGAGWGWRGRGWGWGGYYDDWDYGTATRQLYIRRVDLNIYKGDTYNAPKREKVFEGQALSQGQNGQIAPVMPYMLDALFKNFPGASGQTEKVSVRVPENVETNGKTTSSSSSY